MNEVVLLRLAHIVPGVFWVGAAVFLAAFLEPVLARLGPSVQGPVMSRLGRTAGPVLSAAALLTVASGFILVARTPGHDFGDLFTNTWGWAIGVGAVAGTIAVLLGLAQGASAREIGGIMSQTDGGGPTPAQSARLADLGDRMRLIGRVDAVLVIVAVALMASARFWY